MSLSQTFELDTRCEKDNDGFCSLLRAQNEEAFEELVARYTGFIFKQVRLVFYDSHQVEDIVQEVFWKIFRSLPRFEGNKLTAWIARISYNHCIDEVRRVNRGVKTVDKPLEGIPAGSGSVACELPGFLEKLSPLERQLMLFRSVDGLSYQEISEITGKAEGTLRNLFSKTLNRLRKEVDSRENWMCRG